jgi:PAS domain S-box-containing protein
MATEEMPCTADVAKMFRTLLAASDDVFAVIAPQSGFLFLSPSVKRLLGWTPEELLGCVARGDMRARAVATRVRAP